MSPAGRPPIVLVHGAWGRTWVWRRLLGLAGRDDPQLHSAGALA